MSIVVSVKLCKGSSFWQSNITTVDAYSGMKQDGRLAGRGFCVPPRTKALFKFIPSFTAGLQHITSWVAFHYKQATAIIIQLVISPALPDARLPLITSLYSNADKLLITPIIIWWVL